MSKSFAVIIDNNDKKFCWGKIEDKQYDVMPSEPFFRQHNPTDIKNLNNKYIESVTCGDQFVISLGRDVTFK